MYDLLGGSNIKKIAELFKKYREIILYAFFGGLTTLVNQLCFGILNATLTGDYSLSIAIGVSWFVSVLFAYVVNRIWVFRSISKDFKSIMREILSFFGARVFSGLLDYLFVYYTVSTLGFNANLMKLVSNIAVIILNYIFSKLIVFKDTGEK